jgi:hypothetical protein
MACGKVPWFHNASLPASETVQDGEGNAPAVRGRGKTLENWERMAILQVLLSRTKTRYSNMALLVLFRSSSRSQGSLSLTAGREEDRVWKMVAVEPWWACTKRRSEEGSQKITANSLQTWATYPALLKAIQKLCVIVRAYCSQNFILHQFHD